MNLKTDEAMRWEKQARLLAGAAASACGWGRPVAEKVIVELVVFWPDNRARDTHNLHKPLADALEGIYYTNDRYALLRDIDYDVDKRNPRVEVTIRRSAA